MLTDREQLAELVEQFARLFAREIVRELRDDSSGWVDQHGSPLGNRRHCAAVRRRLTAGLAGAAR
jgi:hypothetical protein